MMVLRNEGIFGEGVSREEFRGDIGNRVMAMMAEWNVGAYSVLYEPGVLGSSALTSSIIGDEDGVSGLRRFSRRT